MIVAVSKRDIVERQVKKQFRLTRSTDFKRVRRIGKSYAHPLVVLVVAPNEEQTTRMGVISGKWVGGAVERNRVKRLLREALRIVQPTINKGFDIIFIARKPILKSKLFEIQNAVDTLLKRADLIT